MECTVNRVGDAYYDQLDLSGHAARLDDLDRFADLGVRTLRYPILWERTAPDGLDRADWRWADERLGRLRELGIRPIVGLVHHGSGPRATNLIDAAFPNGLAKFARAVAARYPWVEDFTPVNEPLTTARFSGLYGHWYPHGRDGRVFARALVTQCRAVVAAMRAIREVTPGARLVQTEDLGKVHATPTLAYQAGFENERRWLSFDLLCGRVDRHHPMWGHLRYEGLAEGEITPFLDDPCPPDLFGINHYLTSERFLDERLERYPPQSHGGNASHRYADVEAVRVLATGMAGTAGLLRETWERYRAPVAITEAHLGCSREEQVRWLAHVWEAALAAREAGAHVRAVTAWSLLGAYDWDSLLTRQDGRYEPGVFDLRAPQPRPTALAGLVRDLATGNPPCHPVLGTPGWWLRPHRITFPTAIQAGGGQPRVNSDPTNTATPVPTPVVIIGGGALADGLARVCDARHLPYRVVRSLDVDESEPMALYEALSAIAPWVVLDADERLDAARPGRATAVARACAQRSLPLLVFSSALVFGNGEHEGYVESDPVAPRGSFGSIAAAIEAGVRRTHPTALVVRTGPLFGSWAGEDPLVEGLRTLAGGNAEPLDDALVSPSYVPDLVHACLDLVIDREQGVWHLANAGAIRWSEFVRRAAEDVGPDAGWMTDASGDPRVPSRVLASERAAIMPSLEDAFARYRRERDPALIGTPPDVDEAEVATTKNLIDVAAWADDDLRRAS